MAKAPASPGQMGVSRYGKNSNFAWEKRLTGMLYRAAQSLADVLAGKGKAERLMNDLNSSLSTGLLVGELTWKGRKFP